MPKDLLNYVSLQKNLIGTCHLVKSQNLARWMYHPSSILAKITDAYDKNPEIENLLLDDYFVEITKNISNQSETSLPWLSKLAYLYRLSHQPSLTSIHTEQNVCLQI